MKKSFLRILLTVTLTLAVLAQLSMMPVKARHGRGNDFKQDAPWSNLKINDHFDWEMLRGWESGVHPTQPNVAVLEGKVRSKASALWAKKKLDLTIPSKGESYIYLGNYDKKLLADGLTLTFHNDLRGAKAIGGVGQGIGTYPHYRYLQNKPGHRVTNTLVFEVDTFVNNNRCSLKGSCYDYGFKSGNMHAAFVKGNNMANQCTGINNHSSFSMLNNTPGFGFHKWVPLNFEWTPTTNNSGKMKVTLGTQVYEYPISDVKSYFNLKGEDKSVYWGYTGSTGSGIQVAGVSMMKLPEQAQADVSVVNSVRNIAGEDVDGKGVPQGSIVRYTTKITEAKNMVAIPRNSRFAARFSQGVEYVGNATYRDVAGIVRPIQLSSVNGELIFDVPDEIRGKEIEISYDLRVTGAPGTTFTGDMKITTPIQAYNGNQLSSTVIEATNVALVNSGRNNRGEDVNGKEVPQESIVRYTTNITESENVIAIPMNSRFNAILSSGLQYVGNATYKDINGAIRPIALQPVENGVSYVVPDAIKGQSVEISFDTRVTGFVGTNITYNTTLQSTTNLYNGNRLNSTISAKEEMKPVLTINPEIISLPLNAPTPNVMQGVSATDEKDGDITRNIFVSPLYIDTTKAGQHIINYQVTNSSGVTTRGRRIYIIDGIVGQNEVIFANDFKITTAEVDTLNPNAQILERSNARIERFGEPGVIVDPSNLVILNNGGYQPEQHAYIAAIGSKTDASVQMNVRAVVGYYGPLASANNIKVVSNNAYLTKVEGAEFAAKLLTDRKWAEEYIIERAKALSWNATTKEAIPFQTVRGLEQINEVKKATTVQLVTAAGDEYAITVFVDYGNQTEDIFPANNTKMKIEVR